jgi:hypothetical protein
MTERREDFLDDEYVAPQGALEQAVADVSAEVLGVDRVGRTDSYYDFGATSLQAVRICARLHRLTEIEAQPVWLFDNDVIADFAARLREVGSGDVRIADGMAGGGMAGGGMAAVRGESGA